MASLSPQEPVDLAQRRHRRFTISCALEDLSAQESALRRGPMVVLEAPDPLKRVLVKASGRSRARRDQHGLAKRVLIVDLKDGIEGLKRCLLYTSPSPRDRTRSRMPSSA